MCEFVKCTQQRSSISLELKIEFNMILELTMKTLLLINTTGLVTITYHF